MYQHFFEYLLHGLMEFFGGCVGGLQTARSLARQLRTVTLGISGCHNSSHRQQRPTPQPRPLPRHGLPRNTDNMADFTKEATFKAVQIDALVRATSAISKTPPAAPLLFFSRHCIEIQLCDRRLTVNYRWLSSLRQPAESRSPA